MTYGATEQFASSENDAIRLDGGGHGLIFTSNQREATILEIKHIEMQYYQYYIYWTSVLLTANLLTPFKRKTCKSVLVYKSMFAFLKTSKIKEELKNQEIWTQ